MPFRSSILARWGSQTGEPPGAGCPGGWWVGCVSTVSRAVRHSSGRFSDIGWYVIRAGVVEEERRRAKARRRRSRAGAMTDIQYRNLWADPASSSPRSAPGATSSGERRPRPRPVGHRDSRHLGGNRRLGDPLRHRRDLRQRARPERDALRQVAWLDAGVKSCWLRSSA